MSKRKKTNYPGVFYREAKRIGDKGTEKVYYVVFKKNGKLIEEKAGRQFADDITPARAASVRGELIEGKRLTRKEKREQEKKAKEAKEAKWTIDRLFKEYIEGRPDNKARKVDKGRYEKYLEGPFGAKEPKDIVPLDVDRLRIKLLKKLASQTVKHILNLLTWIINFGVKKNLCEGISFHIQKPTVSNIKTEDLTEDQLKKLLKAIEKDSNIQIKNLMKMVLYTGIRRGELFKLKWKHIDFDRRFIHLVDPKGGPDQKVPLNDAARELLSSHPKNGSPYVFPGRNGKQRVSAQSGVNKIKTAAGLPKDFRPLHGLRHFFASMLASSGEVDMYVLQKLLTHKSPQMTQRYAHLRDEALKKAAGLAGSIIEQAASGSDKEKVVNLEDHKT
ncbi:MAG: site-specific integrase [Thermodesulfobacteriota bacterium]|nr:site-specific integrase [Thermodesulfobacteriota bacterium]